MGASFFVAICSSICFMFGVWIVNSAWGISIGTEHIALPIAFLAWLAMCGLFHGLKYCEHRKHSTEEMDDQLFEETAYEKPQDAVAADETAMPSESINSSDRRHVMHKDSTNAAGHGYFYQTGKDALCDKLLLESVCSFA